jgi:hypothetical protein
MMTGDAPRIASAPPMAKQSIEPGDMPHAIQEEPQR